jgi:Xaa-Pro aminopeptidase
MNKAQALQQKIQNHNIENFAIFNPANITYFSHSQCPAALLISKNGEKTLYVIPSKTSNKPQKKTKTSKSNLLNVERTCWKKSPLKLTRQKKENLQLTQWASRVGRLLSALLGISIWKLLGK